MSFLIHERHLAQPSIPYIKYAMACGWGTIVALHEYVQELAERCLYVGAVQRGMPMYAGRVCCVIFSNASSTIIHSDTNS